MPILKEMSSIRNLKHKHKDIFIELSDLSSINSSDSSEPSINENDFDISDISDDHILSNGDTTEYQKSKTDEGNVCVTTNNVDENKIKKQREKLEKGTKYVKKGVKETEEIKKETKEDTKETEENSLEEEEEEEEEEEKKKQLEKQRKTEYYVIAKYVKSVLKNKEKEEMYKFYKYISDTNLFVIFIELFINLIKNKNNIENPYSYIVNCFDAAEIKKYEDSDKRKIQEREKEKKEKEKLINENNFYRKENKILLNKINHVEVEIYNLLKNKYTKIITNFCFQKIEQFNETYFFAHFLRKENEQWNIVIEQSFIFTKESFSMFILFLNDSQRKILYDILIDKREELNTFSFFKKMIKKFQKFVEFYSTFDSYEQDNVDINLTEEDFTHKKK